MQFYTYVVANTNIQPNRKARENMAGSLECHSNVINGIITLCFVCYNVHNHNTR